MVALFLSLIGALRSAFRTRADLALENLALRQQLANLRRTSGRPRLRKSDRVFGLVLSRLWSRPRQWLVLLVEMSRVTGPKPTGFERGRKRW